MTVSDFSRKIKRDWLQERCFLNEGRKVHLLHHIWSAVDRGEVVTERKTRGGRWVNATETGGHNRSLSNADNPPGSGSGPRWSRHLVCVSVC